MTCFAIAAGEGASIDILMLADQMEELGWKMERQQKPHSLHVTVMPHHLSQADKFPRDLQDCVDKLRVSSNLKLARAVEGVCVCAICELSAGQEREAERHSCPVRHGWRNSRSRYSQ